MKRKAYFQVELKTTDDGTDPNGTFEAVLSAPTVDRDGEVIDYGAFNPLPKSIPILTDHWPSVDNVVARAVPSYENGVLIARGRFGSDAHSQMVRQKLRDGLVDTMSVGFMEREGMNAQGMAESSWVTVQGTRHWRHAELLESSFVVIPSNREAVLVGVKGDKAGRRNSQADQERIQKAHDLLTEAGAACDADGDMDGDGSAADQTDAFDLELAKAQIAVLVELADLDLGKSSAL